MRVPLSWLREYAGLPDEVTGRDLAARLISAGLEVETVHELGADLTGPVVVGRVLTIEDLTGFKKPIRHCTVEVGESEPRSIVCGATNFAPGDLVVVSLPGAVLPGGFAIASRQTYGRLSDGMICSARELALGDEHDGILVLPAGAGEPGDDAVSLLGLRDEVLDIAVTADRGYALSIRGVAREAATAYAVPFGDPAAGGVVVEGGDGYPVHVEDPSGCDVFVALTVTGIDPSAPSPLHLQERVRKAGMRSISLAVDVTNVVMLELGQPLHAYDRDRLTGAIGVRRARAGEQLETLDGTKRTLDPEDLLITDDSGPIGLAGMMGGASTEIGPETHAVVIEAAHFDPATIARASRRHRLSSEASRRFERGVDPALPLVAAQRAAELLVRHAGGTVAAQVTIVGAPAAPSVVVLPVGLPDRIAGYRYGRERVEELLAEVGCRVESRGDELAVTPPSWRPDLTDPYDFVEEVTRLHGLDAIPSVLPSAPPGRGLTAQQKSRRRLASALADSGYVETLTYPFVSPATWDFLHLPSDDRRRMALRLANPLSEEDPLLRTTLLPGLLGALQRNMGRGLHDTALWEAGRVFFAGNDSAVPRLPVDRRPEQAEQAALYASVPEQPRHVAAVLTGNRDLRGWWGPGRPAAWSDAVQAARVAARAVGAELQVRAGRAAPWHPGRCAEFVLPDGSVAGHGGELHPRVTAALELPPRTCAMELNLDALLGAVGEPSRSPRLSNYPPATQDVALIVDGDVPAAEVHAALVEGAGDLLEDIALFDLYRGEQIGEGRKSLAYALRFRAPDRTLTADEASAARESAVAEAGRRTGAVVRA